MILGKMQIQSGGGLSQNPLPVIHLNYMYNNTLYMSNDLGVSWTTKLLPGAYRWGSMASKNRGNLLAMATYSDSQMSFYSLNGGTTIQSDGQINNYGINAKISNNGQVFVFVTGLSNNGFRISLDAGVNWQTRSTNYNSYCAAIANNGNEIYLADYNNGLYKTINYGLSFVQLTNDKPLRVIASSDGKHLYYKSHANKDRMYYSTDQGATFNYIKLSRIVNSASLCASDSGQYVMVIGGNDCYLSNDYGASYQDISGQLPNFYMNSNANQYISPSGQYIVIPSYSGIRYELFVSTNYGATFISRNLPKSSGTPIGLTIS